MCSKSWPDCPFGTAQPLRCKIAIIWSPQTHPKFIYSRSLLWLFTPLNQKLSCWEGEKNPEISYHCVWTIYIFLDNHVTVKLCSGIFSKRPTKSHFGINVGNSITALMPAEPLDLSIDQLPWLREDFTLRLSCSWCAQKQRRDWEGYPLGIKVKITT